MISLSWVSSFEPNSYDGDKHIGKLMKAFRGLPRHIAKKHIKAAMKRTIKPGVPILRSLTPPLSTRRGRRKKGEKARSTGELRRSVMAKTGQTGNNKDFVVSAAKLAADRGVEERAERVAVRDR